MTLQRYMQPVAVHRAYPERLLLTDDASRWYLWLGDEGAEPIEIPFRLASYLVRRWEMQALEGPRMWFVVDDLPVRATPEPAGSSFPV